MTSPVFFDPGFHPAEKQTGGVASGRPIYQLLEAYPWACAGIAHIVPKWFRYDYASVPRIAWSLIPPNDPQYSGAARIHDYLYETHIYSRDVSDWIMLEGFRLCGVPRWKRIIMFSAVRSFGAEPWRHSETSINYWRLIGGYPAGITPIYGDPRKCGK